MKKYYSLNEAAKYLAEVTKQPISENDVIYISAQSSGCFRLCVLLDECYVAKFPYYLDKPDVEIKNFSGFVKIPEKYYTFDKDETIYIDYAEVIEPIRSKDGKHIVFNPQPKHAIRRIRDQEKFKNRFIILPFEEGSKIEFEPIMVKPQKIRISTEDLLAYKYCNDEISKGNALTLSEEKGIYKGLPEPIECKEILEESGSVSLISTNLKPDENYQFLITSPSPDDEWLIYDSWSLDMAVKLITIGCLIDLKQKSIEAKKRPLNSIERNHLDSMTTVFVRATKIAQSSKDAGRIKDPDSPENWIEWANNKGYNIDHLDPSRQLSILEKAMLETKNKDCIRSYQEQIAGWKKLLAIKEIKLPELAPSSNKKNNKDKDSEHHIMSFLRNVAKRAKDSGIEIDLNAMPGTRADLYELWKTLHPKEKQTFETFKGWLKNKSNAKFKPGASSTNTYRKIFPLHFKEKNT